MATDISGNFYTSTIYKTAPIQKYRCCFGGRGLILPKPLKGHFRQDFATQRLSIIWRPNHAVFLTHPIQKQQIQNSICCFWWKGVDSNHRSRRRQIYSLLPLAAREPFRIFVYDSGAGDWNRTRNLLITNQLLCQLSYASKGA